jgi:hypothetical protein
MYHVCVQGTGGILDIDEGKLEAGFFKNLYVWALSERNAVESAFAQIRNEIANQSGYSITPERALVLEVDSVHPSFAFWRTVFSQGFIFYPIDQ